MSLRRQYLDDCIQQIKEALEVEQQPDFESKDIYLRSADGKDLVGLHTYGDRTELGFQQYEAWANAYSDAWKFIGSIYRIFGPIEEEAEEMKKEGWVVVQKPEGIK